MTGRSSDHQRMFLHEDFVGPRREMSPNMHRNTIAAATDSKFDSVSMLVCQVPAELVLTLPKCFSVAAMAVGCRNWSRI